MLVTIVANIEVSFARCHSW